MAPAPRAAALLRAVAVAETTAPAGGLHAVGRVHLGRAILIVPPPIVAAQSWAFSVATFPVAARGLILLTFLYIRLGVSAEGFVTPSRRGTAPWIAPSVAFAASATRPLNAGLRHGRRQLRLRASVAVAPAPTAARRSANTVPNISVATRCLLVFERVVRNRRSCFAVGAFAVRRLTAAVVVSYLNIRTVHENLPGLKGIPPVAEKRSVGRGEVLGDTNLVSNHLADAGTEGTGSCRPGGAVPAGGGQVGRVGSRELRVRTVKEPPWIVPARHPVQAVRADRAVVRGDVIAPEGPPLEALLGLDRHLDGERRFAAAAARLSEEPSDDRLVPAEPPRVHSSMVGVHAPFHVDYLAGLVRGDDGFAVHALEGTVVIEKVRGVAAVLLLGTANAVGRPGVHHGLRCGGGSRVAVRGGRPARARVPSRGRHPVGKRRVRPVRRRTGDGAMRARLVLRHGETDPGGRDRHETVTAYRPEEETGAEGREQQRRRTRWWQRGQHLVFFFAAQICSSDLDTNGGETLFNRFSFVGKLSAV